MRKKLKRLRILVTLLLIASAIACLFGVWNIIRSSYELTVLGMNGFADRAARAPYIAEITEGVVLAIHYFFVSAFFISALKGGLPFTHEIAKEIMIIGYETIMLPIVAWIITSIAYAGIKSPVVLLEISVYEVVLGFALIVVSYMIEYGTKKIEIGHIRHEELRYIERNYPDVMKEARAAVVESEGMNTDEFDERIR